jgi:hypothetical protein
MVFRGKKMAPQSTAAIPTAQNQNLRLRIENITADGAVKFFVDRAAKQKG